MIKPGPQQQQPTNQNQQEPQTVQTVATQKPQQLLWENQQPQYLQQQQQQQSVHYLQQPLYVPQGSGLDSKHTDAFNQEVDNLNQVRKPNHHICNSVSLAPIIYMKQYFK